MKNDFIVAINQVCAERGLSKDVVLKAVEDALISAYRKDFGYVADISVELDSSTGGARLFAEKTIVVEVLDEDHEIDLAHAQRLRRDAQLGERIKKDITPKNFGRIATQAAKQAILQRIRGAERDALFVQYQDREGEIVNGTVQSVDRNGLVRLSLGKVEAVLPKSEQIPSERFRIGQRVRAYVYSVQKEGSRGPQVSVSRTRREMLRRLLELEVPEIFNGTVEIKMIAREAGQRSKVAVSATQEGIDPVGACVGMKGSRIQSVVNELSGEKIDVVQWNSNPVLFVGNSLSPARVLDVYLDESHQEGNTAVVVVPDKQLSLAIGKEGQNARLAAKLTGWRIDIKSASEAAKETVRLSEARRRMEEADAQRVAEQKRLEEARSLLAAAELAEQEEGEIEAPGELPGLEPTTETTEKDVLPKPIAEPPLPEAVATPPEEVAEESKEVEKPPEKPKPAVPAWVRKALEQEKQDVKVQIEDLIPEEKKRKKKKQKRRPLSWQEELENWKDENVLESLNDTPLDDEVGDDEG